MKPAKKSYIVLCLIVLVAVSCGPVTPVATPTVSKPLSSSTLPVVTPSPTSISLSPSHGPDKDISYYRLRTWTEADYNRLVVGLEDLVGEGEGQVPYFMLSDYRTAFQLEHLLKLPDSPTRNDILWDILVNKPGTIAVPGNQSTGDLMSLLISDLLAQNVQTAKLSTELEKHGLSVASTITVPNLIGNGEDGLILLISMHNVESLVGVFAIFRENEKAHVNKIKDWEVSEAPAMGRYFEIYDVGDTNRNGLPEIIVQVQTGGSGIPQTWKENIDQIEWSPENRTFRSKSFPVFWQDCDQGPCEGDWEFSTSDSQSILITRSYWSTRRDCSDLAIRRTFVWNGTEYILGNIEVVPPRDDFTPECRLAWAETAIWMPASIWDNSITQPGWKNDLAISIVEKSLNSWPAAAHEIWGSASRDYFMLKLGIWYELRNETGKAKFLLNQVANKPYQTEYDFMSQLASLYLEERASSGRVRACLELENAYFEEFRMAIPEPSPYNNDEAMLKVWGLVDGKGSFCDVYEMLPIDVENAQLTSPESLMGWLEKTALTTYQDTRIDLNNDNLEDYVILLDTMDVETADAWAFLAAPKGYQAIDIGDVWPGSEQSELNIPSINIDAGAPAHLILQDGILIIFHVVSNTTIKTWGELYDVQSFEILDETSPAKVLVHIDSSYDGQKTIVYQWDSSAQDFVEQADTFATVQAESEKILYVEEDYQGTISYINKFLQTAPAEPQQAYVCGVDIPEGCKYLPDWYVPYFRYMRGLAYEQLEQPEQARQAYFELWRDFPANVFGMAASLKLEPVKP